MNSSRDYKHSSEITKYWTKEDILQHISYNNKPLQHYKRIEAVEWYGSLHLLRTNQDQVHIDLSKESWLTIITGSHCVIKCGFGCRIVCGNNCFIVCKQLATIATIGKDCGIYSGVDVGSYGIILPKIKHYYDTVLRNSADIKIHSTGLIGYHKSVPFYWNGLEDVDNDLPLLLDEK